MHQHDSTVLEKLGELLSFTRKSARLSQRELAAKLAYSRTTISRIERGKRDVGLFELKQLFAACGFVYTLSIVSDDRPKTVIASL